MIRCIVLAAVASVAVSRHDVDMKCLTADCQQAASDLLDVMNNVTHPCDNFYDFACGHFQDKYGIPEGQILWDNFQMLQRVMDVHSRDILGSAVQEGEPEALIKAKNMYSACMDTGLQNRQGTSSMVHVLQHWGHWPLLRSESFSMDWNSLGDIVAQFAVPFVFSVSSLASLDNANTTAIYLDVPSLVLPTPLLFHEDQPHVLQDLGKDGDDVQDLPFTRYLVKMASILREKTRSEETVESDMVDVVHFMQKLQQAGQMSREDDDDKMAWTIAELDEYTQQRLGNKTSMVWLQFLQRVFGQSGVTVHAELPVLLLNGPDCLLNIVKLIEGTDPRIVANYVISRLMVYLSPESSRELRAAAMDFYVEMEYIPDNYERWQYCVHKVQDYNKVGLSHAVACKYREQVGQDGKATEMVAHLQAAFKELLQKNTWMDDHTRQMAADKVDAMLVLSGVPSFCSNSSELDAFYSNLEINPRDHFGNVARLRAFEQNLGFATLGKPRERNDWTQSPLIVNAFYNSLNNRITFPIAMMALPFFSGKTSETALDYGRIGAILGHEITHGFDSVGRQYDKFGSAYDWWSNDTAAKFDEKAQCFVKQYDQYVVPELNVQVNGSRTLRENIADNGGVREAFEAFQKLGGARLPGLETYSPEQLFFIGYATMWCRAETVSGTQAMLQKDSHSPNRFRVIGSLSNMEEFSQVFRCPPGSGMNPELKCVLW